MLIFSRNIIFCPKPDSKLRVYNISSLLEGYTMLTHLNPPRTVNGYVLNPNDPDSFYQLFKLHIAMNKDAFLEIMDIVYPLYEGEDVILLVGPDDNYRTAFMGSMIKYITERYGYVANTVWNVDDIYRLVEGDFSIFGLANLDQDKEVYTNIQAGLYMPNIGRGLDDYD